MTSHIDHLQHLEDYVFLGSKGARFSHGALKTLKKWMIGQGSLRVSTKYDGAPSVVFGHVNHAGKTGKQFFVATKSAFNLEPKLNFTHADVDANHGTQPGLAVALKYCLEYLPKICPLKGVYQGDLMFTTPELGYDSMTGLVSFRPNTLTYSVPMGSPAGGLVVQAKLGLCVHTRYVGDSIETVQLTQNVDWHNFRFHEDVFLIVPDLNSPMMSDSKYFNTFDSVMSELSREVKARSDMFEKAVKHATLLRKYGNKVVREGLVPEVSGYVDFLLDQGVKAASTVKTSATKTDKLDHYWELSREAQNSFKDLFPIYDLFQGAKNLVVAMLDDQYGFIHTINGKPSEPEGYVMNYLNQTVKLVNRAEFSASNFMYGKYA